MIHGCGGLSDVDKMLGAQPAVVTNTVAVACPEFAKEDRAKGEILPQRPATWAKKGATKKDLLGHIDLLEGAVATRNDTIKRMDAEHEKCRGTLKDKPST